MRKVHLALIPFLALALVGCDDDNGTSGDGGADLSVKNGDGSTPGGGDGGSNFPAAPTLGAQIDRMGRAGVNTAVTDPFWNPGTGGTAGAQTTAHATHTAKQDFYNQAAQSTWPTFVTAYSVPGQTGMQFGFDQILAVYDGADGVCSAEPGTAGATAGTQAGFDLGHTSSSTHPYGQYYDVLAGLLADDRLVVDTTQATCAQYLAAELQVLGYPVTDCGGRTPTENVIDPTYNAVIGIQTGATLPTLVGSPAIANGVTANAESTSATTQMTFPFLGAPN